MHCIPVRNASSLSISGQNNSGVNMIDTHGRQIVNTIFERLIAINPAFKQAWPTDVELAASKKQWIEAFKDAQMYDLNLIKKGLRKVRLSASPFPPSPGMFIKLCEPEADDVGAPKVCDAYDEAVKNAYPDGADKKWSHAAVKLAYHKTGPFFLRTESKDKTYPQFKVNYEDAIEQYFHGRNMNQLESKKSQQAYQEYVGKIKSGIQLGLLGADTKILSYDKWVSSYN